jgi:biopolymer transport protein ExbD
VVRRTSLTSLRQISEINLTPLMDLTFILLITFIITFPLIEQGIHVNVPEGKGQEVSAETARTVSLDGGGHLYLDDFPVTLA